MKCVLSHSRSAKGQRWRRSARTARQLCLIGPAAMLDAIREARVHLAAAEVKICLARVPHRPAAYFIRQVQQAGFVLNRRIRLGRHEPARRCWRDWRLLITRALAQEPAWSNRDNLGQIGRRIRDRLRGHALLRCRIGGRCCCLSI